MKKWMTWILSLTLLLGLLAGCGTTGVESLYPSGEEPELGKVTRPYKVVNVYDYEGRYSVLAYDAEAERPELTFVSLNDAAIEDEAGNVITASGLRGGMVIEVIWDGMVAESWPCQVRADKVRVAEQRDDLVGLYRSVLNDLWEMDSALNHEAELLGLDFSTLTNLAGIEKEALAYLFSCDVGLGLYYVFGTWEELCDQGYIDRDNLYWENGVFFSIELEEEPGERSFVFDAQKWRSGLGAIFFTECTAGRGADGRWSYESGGFAIA